jgi:hypothetical protein
MIVSCFIRRSVGLSSVVALSLLAACSDDTTTSSSPDAASPADAASESGDSAPADAAGDSSPGVVDAADASQDSTPSDSSPSSDGGGESSDATDAGEAAESGTGVDGAPDALVDASSPPVDATIGDDGANDATTVDSPPAVDGSVDALVESGIASEDAPFGGDAANDVTTDDGSLDALADTGSSPDSGAMGDAAEGGSDGGVLLSYTFDTDNQNWWWQGTWPNVYADGGTTFLQSNSYVQASTIFGNPAGSLKIYGAFDGPGEKVTAGTTFYPYPYVDLTSKTISADVFLADGSQQYSYFYLFCQDQNGNWMDGGPNAFPAVAGGAWLTVSTDITNPAGYVSNGFDRSKIRLIGVEVDSGNGAGSGTITPVTVYVDNVIVQ